ncbi:MAG: RHS repeat-associated core domain-containing protein [Bacteroidales bacterium]|jgi:RHS repeat-associated protein|nr:RHS repeat-associated core domain-containing protein [Bacteroidales bacterium]
MKNGIEEITKHYYTGNHLSSTQLVTDGTGVAVQQVEYAPFGEVVNEYNIDWSDGQVPDFKFNGKELDEENGMYYFEARYQSPPVFISRDGLFEEKHFMSPYSYCSNSPINRVDPSGLSDYDDVVITGANNSSLTIKTNAVDIKINSNIDFGGNQTITDVSNLAIGYEIGLNATGAAAVGTSFNAYTSSVLFLGGDYAGYWYDYAGVESQVIGTTSVSAAIGGQFNIFLAWADDKEFYTPKDFAGKYYGGNVSVGLQEVLGGLSLNGQYAYSKPGWNVLSFGVSAAVGPQQGFFAGFSASAGGHAGYMGLLTTPKPTRQRSMFDIGFN